MKEGEHKTRGTYHKPSDFHTTLRDHIVCYIKEGYSVIKKFPKEEMYALSAQGKRSLASIFLNYTEGYSRKGKNVTRHLYEVAYGSLQESIGVFYLAVHLGFIEKSIYINLYQQKEQIARMLWKTIEGVSQDTT